MMWKNEAFVDIPAKFSNRQDLMWETILENLQFQRMTVSIYLSWHTKLILL